VNRQFLGGRPDEELSREQRVVGPLADDPDREPVGRVGPREDVLDPDRSALEVRDDAVEECVEASGVERLVDLAPVDPVGARRLADPLIAPGPSVLPRRAESPRPGEEGPMDPAR